MSGPQIEFSLNARDVRIAPAVGERLSESLRERLGAKEVKVGCDAGDCGACTVLLDGQPVCACLTAAHQVRGRRVETVSGVLEFDGLGTSLSAAFQDCGAAQCGICTPGMVVSAAALLRRNPSPSEEEVGEALGGVLCRCTGYRKIIEAVLTAAEGNGRLSGRARTGIGHRIRRIDGRAKVSGEEVYGDDAAEADWLSVRVIRSPYARAAFEFGDLNGLIRRHAGMEAVLTAADIRGVNSFGVIPGFIDQPVFAVSEARFRGEAVAAIVGERRILAEFNPADFPVTWRQLPAAEGFDGATAAGAPQVHTGRPGNIMCRGTVRRGEPEAALRRAALVAAGEFETSFVEHAYIEPEAGCARFRDGRLEVCAGTQAPVMNLESLADILAMKRSEIRIVPTATGGGFGSKLDLSVQPFLALAALKTGKPVRMAYSRTESMQATTKRHPAKIRMTIGVSGDGRVSGMTYDGTFNTGAYASWGPTVVNRVPVHASGPYFVKDYRADTRALHTHSPPAGAFRGFGVPQSAVAQEILFDDLAVRLSADPLEFRIRNALGDGMPTVCGQVFRQGVGIGECFRSLRPAWQEARRNARDFNEKAVRDGLRSRRGSGVAGGWYGCGNTSLPNPSTIKAGIRPDGTVVLHQGAVDIGQGANTVIAQIFAEALGVTVDQLTLAGADTDITPDAGKTSASRQTFVSGNAAKRCGEALRGHVLRLCNASGAASVSFRKGAAVIQDGDGEHFLDLLRLPVDSTGYALIAEATYDPPTEPLDKNGQGVPYAQFGYAAQICEVEVDLTLGTVRPLRFTAAHDVGKAINPLLIEGQIEGGIAQGLGMALMEEYVPGRTENLHDYLVPTIGDMPPVESIIVEVPDEAGPYGAKGLGEHALIPTAPAILNAVRHACGARVTELPAVPSRVLAAIKAASDA